MNEMQLLSVAMSFVVLALATIAEMRHWWREGSRAQRILLFLSGVGVIGFLAIARLPPSWFDGGKAAFVLGLSFLIAAFIGPAPHFRKPLFLGMAGVMLGVNLLVAVWEGLR